MLLHGVHEGRVLRRGDVLGAEVLGLVGEVDREAAHGLALRAELLGGQRGHRGRVEPAGEQGAARHVGHQLPGDDVLQQLAHVRDRGLLAVGVLGGLQLPVRAFPQPVAVEHGQVAGAQFAHALPDGEAGGLGEGEDLPQPVRADDGGGQRVGEDRLGLGAEQDAVVGLVVVEGLDAHPVADHDELLGPRVPDGEGVHAVELVGQLFAPLQVAAEHDLGVGVGLEPVAAAAQFVAELDVVVRLAGVHHRDRAVLGAGLHGLRAAREVDDGEPAVAEGGAGGDPGTLGVGSPAGHRLGHGVHGLLVSRQITSVGDPASDATHSDQLLSPRG